MVTDTHHAGRHGWWRSLRGVPVIALFVAIIAGTTSVALGTVAWSQVQQLQHSRALLEAWTGTEHLGVFYPWTVVPEQRSDPTSFTERTMDVASAELYPLLDERGALYVDAKDYEEGVPAPLAPAFRTMLVNPNYLSRFPVLDRTGQPIRISEAEEDWVVILPESLRDDATATTRIHDWIQSARTGNSEVEGAVQVQERSEHLPTVPERFRTQTVKIVWSKQGQDVFSLDSRVAPDAGNTIADPFIEVSTRGNSLAVDHTNAVTGDPNTAMKVRLDRSPEQTYAELRPTLERLGLAAQFTTLISVNDAAVSALGVIDDDVNALIGAAGGLFVVAIGTSALFVGVVLNRSRRRFAIRRMMGFSRRAAYREVTVSALVGWSILVCLSIPITRLASAELVASASGQSPHGAPWLPAAILLTVAAAEALTIALVITVTERIPLPRRLQVR